MKKFPIRSWFNLIEVTMAVAVVGIGIAGVMALFPPAIEANKNADFQNFTGTVVNNVATYLDYRVKNDWTTFTGSKLHEKASATEPAVQTNTDSWSEIPNFNGVFFTTSDKKDDWLGIRTQDGSIAAHVRIWKDNTHLSNGYFDAANDPTPVPAPPGFRIRIIVELSWPIHVTYAQREKQEFVYEFSKRGN